MKIIFIDFFSVEPLVFELQWEKKSLFYNGTHAQRVYFSIYVAQPVYSPFEGNSTESRSCNTMNKNKSYCTNM